VIFEPFVDKKGKSLSSTKATKSTKRGITVARALIRSTVQKLCLAGLTN